MLAKIRNGLLALLTGVLFALSPASALAGGIDIEDVDEDLLELILLGGNVGLLEDLIEEAIEEEEEEEEEELEEELEELEEELEEEEDD